MVSEGSADETKVLAPQTVPDLIAPHAAGDDAVDYRIVIPTRGRWRPASEISSERKLSKVALPFILVKTLAFLKKQGISPCRVTMWMADAEELQQYRSALKQDAYWADVECRIGVPGIRNQRNHIALAYEENSYIVSLDDDLGDVLWKQYAGHRPRLVQLPKGGFERLIFHAHACMKKHKAFIWGLATTATKNIMCMFIDGISTRNGEINGFCYGYINRHDHGLLPQIEDATEDAERSLRFFAKDKILLRYRMYCCETNCWDEQGGLQELMGSKDAREEAERRGAAQLHNMFPGQTLSPTKGKSHANLMVKFRCIGGFPLPTTSATVLTAANELEQTIRKLEAENSKRSRKRLVETTNNDAVPSTPTPSQSRSPHFQQLEPPGPVQSIPEKTRKSFRQEDGCHDDEETDEPEYDHGANRPSEIDEGEDENAHFESIVAASLRDCASTRRLEHPHQNEDELIRQAMEASKQELEFKVLLFNGDGHFNEHIEQALEESRKEEERERQLLEQEQEQFLRVKRRSALDLGGSQDADSCSPVVKRQRGAQLLIDMGFSRSDSEKELANADGHIQIALEALLSREGGSDLIAIDSQD